jgi:hypothetical protein
MPASALDPEVLNHFSVIVYPFVHDLTGKNRAPRLEALRGRWEPWWSRLTDDEAADALEAAAFFLPYVRGLLYPETTRLHDEPPGEQNAGWVRHVRRLSGRGLGAFDRKLPPNSILRLTCHGAARDALAAFVVTQPRQGGSKLTEHVDLPARLDWVDALLFPSALGFLVLKVRLASATPRLAQLIRLNRALRLVHAPTLHWALPVLRLGASGEEVRVRDVLDDLTRGLAAGTALGAVGGRSYSDTETGRAYGEQCHLLSFAGVHLTETDRDRLPAGAFSSAEDRMVFEYAACIRLGDSVDNPVWVPSARQAERLSRDNGLSLWRCWRAMALKESLVFLATEDLGFTRRALPHNVEADYLPLYLYTLYQKFQLSIFADGLMREVAEVDGHLRGARSLLRRFVAFRNRFWFSEVTRRPQGGDLYRALQQGLEVPALYQLVTASVKEAKEYYEDRWDRQVRTAVTGLGLVCGPLAAAAGPALCVWSALGPLWAAALLVVLGAGAAALLLRRRRKGRRRAARAGARPPALPRAILEGGSGDDRGRGHRDADRRRHAA